MKRDIPTAKRRPDLLNFKVSLTLQQDGFHFQDVLQLVFLKQSGYLIVSVSFTHGFSLDCIGTERVCVLTGMHVVTTVLY